MSTVYALPSDFTIYDASLTRQEMLGVLASCSSEAGGGVLEVYGGSVEGIDASGVQLLMALHRQCSELGVRWRITRASPALRKALRWLKDLPLEPAAIDMQQQAGGWFEPMQ